jgi:protein-tyrosine-phosphatase
MRSQSIWHKNASKEVAMVTAPTKATKTTDGELSRPRTVCFVCTGNTCRSPMAQAVANALAAQALSGFPPSIRKLMKPPVEAFSAGLYANDGEPIAQNAVAALENAGVASVATHDYHAHTAHGLTEAEVRNKI